MRISILGGGWINKGAEAMTLVTIQELNKRVPQSKFLVYITKKDPRKNEKDTYFEKQNKIQYLVDLFFALLYFLVPLKIFVSFSKNLQEIYKSDFFIDIYGYAIHDKNGFKAILYIVTRVVLIKIFKKKYYIFPQDFGPLKEYKRRWLTKYLLFFADKIYVRGLKSLHCLHSINPHVNITQVPDIAYLFVKDIQKKQIQENIIGVIPNTNLLKNNRYISELVLSIYLLIEKGYSIYLIPHEIKTQGYDDLSLCRDIEINLLEKYPYCKNNISVLDNLNNAIEIKKAIASCDYVISSRFHGAIGALSLSIPTVIVGWSHKYLSIMNQYGLEEYVIDGTSEVFGAKVYKHFINLLEKQSFIQKQLEDVNQELKKEVESFFDEIARDINEK